MFWENFYKLCKEAKKSPNSVAKEIDVSSGAITSWKNGKVPHHSTLLKIATYFNVSVDYLLGNEKGSPSAELLKGLDEVGVQILTIFSELPEEKKPEALSYLEFLAQKGKQDN